MHNIHKGEEIWVLGTGWSLDEFPDDFFRDKIAVAHRGAGLAFPYCNYIWTGYRHPELIELLKSQEKLDFKKLIIGLSGKATPHGQKWLGGDRILSIYMKKKEVRTREKFENAIEEMKGPITQGKRCCHFCYTTTLHFTIEAAIVLGASKITLAGASHRTSEGKFLHAKNRGLSLCYPNDPAWPLYTPPRVFDKCSLATGVLVRVFKSYGISIRRYFYGKGYEEII